MLSVERPSYVVLGLRLSVTSKSHVSHVRYVLNYVLSSPSHRFDACFLEERMCLFMPKWSLSSRIESCFYLC